jgi:phage gp36-like protein
MPYTDSAALTARYGERELIALTDKSVPPAGGINADTVARALADADAEIDSRLVIRYAVPVSPVPAILVDAACRITRYKLHEDRANQKVRQDYEDVIKWLADVAAGRADLPGVAPATSGDPAEGANIGAVAVRAPPAVFTADTLARMP